MSTEQVADKELLIAEYTLGLLDPQETARAQTLLGAEKAAVACALKWEDRFLSLVDQLPPLQPSAQLLQRVQATLGQDITRVERPRAQSQALRTAASRGWNSLWLWRALCLCLAVAALGAGFGKRPAARPAALPAAQPMAPPPKAPPIQQTLPAQVAILQAPGQSSTPAWAVTFNAQHDLVFRPLVHSDLPASSSAQLWTHPTESATPRSLGVIDPNQTIKIPAASLGDIVPGQIFEITLEPQGGSPSGPTGPVLFIGRMVAMTP